MIVSNSTARSGPTAPVPPVSVPLSDLPVGTTATLSGDRLDGHDRAVLRAMGIADRAPVRVCRQGEPCIVEVRSTRLGLSRAIASLLDTIPENPEADETLPLVTPLLAAAAS